MSREFFLCRMIFVVVALTLPLASCHKKTYSDDIYGENHTEKSSKTTSKGTGISASAIPDDWKNLDIKLARGDNKALYHEAKEWLGTPYKYAGMEKQVGTDCSGMVDQIFKKIYNIDLERNSAKIFQKNCKEISRNDLKEGDLVFFHGKKKNRISHVGIYLKEGYFVHASSSRGVVVNSLSQPYFDTHFHCAGRVKK